MTTSIVYHAVARGITIRSMESRLEGDLDLQGFLGIRDDVPRGYKEIRMVVDIDADGSPEELEEIVKLGPTYSPGYHTITRPVPVSVQLKRYLFPAVPSPTQPAVFIVILIYNMTSPT
jgi:uncharacterized OsmC-like protein